MNAIRKWGPWALGGLAALAVLYLVTRRTPGASSSAQSAQAPSPLVPPPGVIVNYYPSAATPPPASNPSSQQITAALNPGIGPVPAVGPSLPGVLRQGWNA